MKLIYLLLLDTNAIRLYTAGGGTHEALSQSDLESKIESATQIQQKQYVETIKNNFEDFEVAFSGFGKELIDLDDQVQVLEEAGIDLPKAQLKRVSVPEIDNVDQTTDTNQKDTKLTVVATQKPVPPIHKVTTTASTTTVEPIGDVEPWKIPKKYLRPRLLYNLWFCKMSQWWSMHSTSSKMPVQTWLHWRPMSIHHLRSNNDINQRNLRCL